MATTEERMRILKMVEEGKITADDAAKLIIALDDSRNPGPRNPKGSPSAGFQFNPPGGRPAGRPSSARTFRVRVTDTRTGKQKVSVNIPIGLVNVGMKIGARFAPEIGSSELTALMEAIHAGQTGKILEVMDNDDGERVEIFVE